MYLSLAMLRSIPLRYISLYGCRRISLKITEPSVENTSALPDGSVIFILAWLVAYSNSISETISSSYIMFLKLHVVSYIRYFHVFFCVIEENADIFMTLTSKVIIAQEQKERQWNFEYFQAFYCFWGHCRIFTFAFRVFF